MLFFFLVFFCFTYCLCQETIAFLGFFFMILYLFFLVFLTFWIFLFCFFSNISDKWGSNNFLSYSFFLSSLFFILFVRFSCFNVFLFYFSFEFIFILMFLFLLGWGYSPERLQASFYMVFYTLVVSFPFLLFLVLSGIGVRSSSFMSFSFFEGF